MGEGEAGKEEEILFGGWGGLGWGWGGHSAYVCKDPFRAVMAAGEVDDILGGPR